MIFHNIFINTETGLMRGAAISQSAGILMIPYLIDGSGDDIDGLFLVCYRCV